MSKIVLKKGLIRWYYNIVSSNGNILSTSQKYFSKSNARRAAKRQAQLTKTGYEEF